MIRKFLPGTPKNPDRVSIKRKVDIETALKVYLPASGQYTWNPQRLVSSLPLVRTVCLLVISIPPMALIAIFAQHLTSFCLRHRSLLGSAYMGIPLPS